MKSALATVGIFFCAVFAAAQVHGIPASVTSPTSQGGFLQPHGIPSSVTSLGPRGFSDDGVFVPSQFHDRRIGLHGFVSPIVFPVAIPFFMVAPQPIIIEAAPQPAQRQIPEHVEVVIRDERGRELPRPGADESGAPSPQTSAAPEPEPQSGPAAVIVFRNGNTRELQDYAIMGKDVYDLAGGRPKKVPLTDVDEIATARANDERGSGFHLPSL